MQSVRVLILGATGMLGHTLFAHLAAHSGFNVYGTARNFAGLSERFPPELREKVRDHVNAADFDTIIRCMAEIQPEVVINCIGIVKQAPAVRDSLKTIMINALLPHRLALLCGATGARLIQISTDCVFDGNKGGYRENDPPNPVDLYGRTKLLGEVGSPTEAHLTLRTSMIGHELHGKYGLIEWFLAQEKIVKGFTGVIFSGFPTIELARVIGAYLISNPALKGMYHLSAAPISKYDLLKLVAVKYDRQIAIEPDANLHSDRSLDSSLFRRVTGYTPPTWPELIDRMRENFRTAPFYSFHVKG